MTPRGRTILIILFLGVLAFGLAVRLFDRGRNQDSAFKGPVDINTATAAELDQVPWLTPAVAAGIVTGRPFASVDELIRVKGIGEKTLAKIRRHLEVSEPARMNPPQAPPWNPRPRHGDPTSL